MKTVAPFVIAVLMTCVVPVGTSAAQDVQANRALVGEVRALAVAPENAGAVATLHSEGWLEARGQLLSTNDYPELFTILGRAWTNDSVPSSRFAIPQVVDRSYRGVSSEDPFGVLGGDAITSGRPSHVGLRPQPLSYWIYVGHAIPADARVAAR